MNLRGPHPLRTLLIGQLLLVMAVAAVVAGTLVVFWRLPMVQQQAEAEQARLTSLALRQLDTSLDTAEVLADSLAQTWTLAGRDPTVSHGDFAMLLGQLAVNTELFKGLYLLDAGHRVLASGESVARQGTPMRALSDGVAMDAVTQAALRRVAVWSDLYLSSGSGQSVVALAMPAGVDVVLIEMSVCLVAHLVEKASELDGLLMLVTDGSGQMLAAPDKPWAPANVRVDSWPVIQAAMQGRQVFDRVNMGSEVFSGTASRSERLGWVVFAGYPDSVTQASRNAAVSITVITMALAVVFGVVTLSLLANQIHRRVETTVEYADNIAQGRYEAPERRSGVLELEHLDRSLTHMARTIQRREQQLRAIVETTPTLAIQLFDRAGRVTDWNPASESILGWPKADAVGKTLDELIYTPAQQRQFMDVLTRIQQTGQPFGPYEGAVRHRDGRELVILSTTFAIPDLMGGMQFVCMDIDITAMKQREADIRSSEHKFNVFFHASPVAVAVLELQGSEPAYVDVNRAWESLLGHSRERVLDRSATPVHIMESSADSDDMIRGLKPNEIVPWVEAWAKRSDGSRFLAEGAIGRVTMDDRTLVIYSIHDVTDKRRMERELRELNAELEMRIARRTESLTQANLALQQAVQDLQVAQTHLVQSEKLASLGSLVAGIAHELNTPIGNGLMAVSTLRQRTEDFRAQVDKGLRRSDLDQYLSRVEAAGDISTRNLERASELIASFKQVAVDQTSVQRRVFDLADLIHENLLTLQPTLRRTPFQVQVEVPSGVTLDSYPGPFGQVLTNLIQNAVVHAFEGRESGQVWVRATQEGDLVELSVSDDGRGISPEIARKVFDPFFTTRLGKGGSGLGLHMAHNMVTGLLGGQIDLRASAAGGAEFVIRCPRVAPDMPRTTGVPT